VAATSLLQLYADAFAAFGDLALDESKAGRIPKRCERGRLRIWRTFAMKIVRDFQHAPMRSWIDQEYRSGGNRPNLHDPADLEFVRNNLQGRSVDIAATFDQPLAIGQPKDRNALVFLRDSAKYNVLFQLVGQRLVGGVDLRRILELFEKFTQRQSNPIAALCVSDIGNGCLAATTGGSPRSSAGCGSPGRI
jgi:hypothetical protein